MESRVLSHDLLPEQWKDEAFIAGGYACNPDLASDIDLWVTVPSGNDIDGVRLDLLGHLRTHGFIFEEQADRRCELETGAIVASEDGYPIDMDTRKVAVVTGRFSFSFAKPIHIILTNGDVTETLNAFDISTHQIALLYPFEDEMFELKGPDWTSPVERPIVLRDTPTTPGRLEKITARYAQFRRDAQAATVEQGVVPEGTYYPFMER